MTAPAWSITFTPYPAAGAHIYGAYLGDVSSVVERVVAELFAAEPTRRAVTVEVSSPCETCGGTGRRSRQRKKLFLDPCRAKGCDGGFRLESAETRLRPRSELEARFPTIRVLWRQPGTLALWGISYEMRAEVGQSPYHLWRAREEHRPPPPGTYAAGPIDLSDWLYLGSPGWFGAHSTDDIAAIKIWLASLPRDAIPMNPCEWTRLAEFGGVS